MRHFKSGKFEREQIPTLIRRFSPQESLHGLEEVSLENLKSAGKSVILLDVDNTLLPWRSEEIPQSTLDWIKSAKQMGFDLCILSNTRNPERLKRLSEKLNIEFIRDKFKPSRRMYHLALEKYKIEQDKAVMLGDQLMTDIWGANRSGIDALWIKPMGKREFVGTTFVSRNVEKIIGHFLYKYFQADGADAETRPGFFRSNIFAQLIKFGVVGAVATLVDLGMHYFLLFKAKVGSELLSEVVGRWAHTNLGLGSTNSLHGLQEAAFGPLKIGPVILAIFVSYLLNRLYTFKFGDQKITVKQVGQFYVIALVGMIIAVSVSTLVNTSLKGDPNADWGIASLAGMIAGFIWNFNGQRLWTFRRKHD